MRAKERKEARRLRECGLSIREIAEKIGCAKSSVSEWVSDIALSPEQIERLDQKQDRARAKAANHPNSPKAVWAKIRNDISKAASQEIADNCSIDVLKVVGSALYWAEGYKQSVNMVSFSNSDPGMIALAMKFFRQVCGVSETKFRGVVHIHPHLDKDRAERFWSNTSGIPLSQFHKTQFGISKASKNKRDTLPLGTFGIIVCDARLKSRIDGWIKGIDTWGKLRAVGAIG